jgi:hypothetical protein
MRDGDAPWLGRVLELDGAALLGDLLPAVRFQSPENVPAVHALIRYTLMRIVQDVLRLSDVLQRLSRPKVRNANASGRMPCGPGRYRLPAAPAAPCWPAFATVMVSGRASTLTSASRPQASHVAVTARTPHVSQGHWRPGIAPHRPATHPNVSRHIAVAHGAASVEQRDHPTLKGKPVAVGYLRTTMLERRRKVVADWAARALPRRWSRSSASGDDDEPHDEA